MNTKAQRKQGSKIRQGDSSHVSESVHEHRTFPVFSRGGNTLCLSTRVTDESLTYSAIFLSFSALSDDSVPGSTLHSGSIV